MKLFLLFCSNVFICFSLAQTPVPANNFVESGKLLIELVKIFRKNPVNPAGLNTGYNSSDLCFTNSTPDNLLIELSKKLNDSSYKQLPVAINLTSKAHECLLEISSGVYHYKVFKKNAGSQILLLEGEMRLMANEKMEREIK